MRVLRKDTISRSKRSPRLNGKVVTRSMIYMMQKSDNLTKVYTQLGKEYLKKIDKSTPPEFKQFIKFLPRRGKILEIGCAGGRDAIKFIKNGFQYTGIDLVDIFLKEARKRAPQGKFIKMDVSKLKFPKIYFDAIWANAILLHLTKKDILQVLKKMHEVLKYKGKLHLRLKQGKGTADIKEKLSGNKARRFTFFQKREIANLLKRAGFNVIFSKIVPDDLGRKNVKWIIIWGEKS